MDGGEVTRVERSEEDGRRRVSDGQNRPHLSRWRRRQKEQKKNGEREVSSPKRILTAGRGWHGWSCLLDVQNAKIGKKTTLRAGDAYVIWRSQHFFCFVFFFFFFLNWIFIYCDPFLVWALLIAS